MHPIRIPVWHPAESCLSDAECAAETYRAKLLIVVGDEKYSRIVALLRNWIIEDRRRELFLGDIEYAALLRYVYEALTFRDGPLYRHEYVREVWAENSRFPPFWESLRPDYLHAAPWRLQHMLASHFHFQRSMVETIGKVIGVLYPPPALPLRVQGAEKREQQSRWMLNLLDQPSATDAVEQMRERGFVSFGQVPVGWTETMLRSYTSELLSVQIPFACRGTDSGNDANRVAVWQSAPGDLLRTSFEAWHIAAHPAIQAVVGAYLGAAPVLIKANAKYSAGNASSFTSSSSQHVLHQDSEPLPLVSVLVYVSDMASEDTTPTRYVRGSHAGEGIQKWTAHMRSRTMRPPVPTRRQLEKEKKQNPHVASMAERKALYYRLSTGMCWPVQEEIHAVFGGGKVVNLGGPAGSIWIMDAVGLHGGSPPRGRRAERRLLHFQFAASSYAVPKESLSPIHLQELPFPAPQRAAVTSWAAHAKRTFGHFVSH
jgi:hypothetical protein